jgi:hypothetical protein
VNPVALLLFILSALALGFSIYGLLNESGSGNKHIQPLYRMSFKTGKRLATIGTVLLILAFAIKFLTD